MITKKSELDTKQDLEKSKTETIKDINDRKHVGKELRKSEELFHLMFLRHDAIMLLIEPKSGQILDANTKAVNFYGYSKTKLTSMKIQEINCLPDEEVEKRRHQALQGISNFNIFEHKLSSNEIRFVEVHSTPIPVKDNELLFSIINDITERKRSENELNANYSLLRIAGESAKFGGWSVDLSSNICTWSDEVANIHEMPKGYSPPVNEGINFYAPEWRKKITKVFSDCAEKGIPYDEELQIITKKGKRIWVRTIGEAVEDENGKIVKVQGAFQNITERIIAEETIKNHVSFLNTVMDNSPIAMWISDMQGTIIRVNTSLLKMLDLSEQAIVGKYNVLKDLNLVKQKVMAKVEAVFEDKEPTRFVIPWISEDTGISGFQGENSIWIDVSMYPVVDANNNLLNVVCQWSNVTEQKQSEMKLRESQQTLSNLLSNLPGMAYRCENDADWTMRVVSAGCFDLTGYSPVELIDNAKISFINIIHPDDRKNVRLTINNALEHKQSYEVTYRIYTAQSQEKWVWERGVGVFSEQGKIIHLEGFISNITKLKQAEDKIKDLAKFPDENPSPVLRFSKKGKILYASKSSAALLEKWGKSIGENVPPEWEKNISNSFTSNVNLNIETLFEGKTYSFILAPMNETGYVNAYGRDITELNDSIKKIELERDKAQKYLDISGVMMLALDEKGAITLINKKGNQILDYEGSDLIGKNWFDTCIPERNRKEIRQVFMDLIKKDLDSKEYYTNPVLTKSGEEKIIAWHNVYLYDERKHPVGSLSSGEEITLRVRTQSLLSALNRASVVMSIALTPQDIFLEISKVMDSLDILCMLFLLDETKSRLLTSYMSFDSAIVNKIAKMIGINPKEFSFKIDDVDIYRTVVRKKESVFTADSKQVVQQVLPKGTKRLSSKIVDLLHVKKGIFAPIIVEEQVIGVFSIQSNTLNENDVLATTAFSHELAGAWNKVKLVQDLRKTVEGTIHTIAATVEARDPYTAGHQTRVADLAVAIASEMNLTNDQIEGIKMAGIVHDLGKISIPAEILNKPGKLSGLEFDLIKTHPQNGFDLLKDIEFPWPIAEMILQHHEKMDGSGYPQGLKGDEIMIEARILTVADILEAMSSHRPYRPALGIEKALAQIKQDKGTLLDPKVVDACLKVFKEGYQLPDDHVQKL